MHGWKAGVRTAGMPGKERIRRVQTAPNDQLTVLGDDGAFISFMPDTSTRLSYGINHAAEAPIIGSQWLSWSPEDGEHYRWAIAPARTYAPSLEVWRKLVPPMTS